MKIAILDFVKQNSPLALFLDRIVNFITETNVPTHAGPADFMKYVYLKPEDIGYDGNCTLATIAGNESHLQQGYESRKRDDKDEPAFLERWFIKGTVTPAPAKGIAICLYNREQLKAEGIEIEEDYGIVLAVAEPEFGILAPMSPNTILRNSLGHEAGGNDTPFDRKAYDESVAYWSRYACVK